MKNYWRNSSRLILYNQAIALVILFVTCICSCGEPASVPTENMTVDSPASVMPANSHTADTIAGIPGGEIVSYTVPPDSIVLFARTLIGVPYLYASTDPSKGFDCSGFITYVFNHFNIKVPRSSVDFTWYGRELAMDSAAPGDLILFTGTDSTIRVVGHMGIVDHRQNDTLYFIHSTSGKAKGVVITPFGKYYKSRFVKTIRVFPEGYFH